MDELAYAKRAVRTYRNALSQIWDEVEARPGSPMAVRVREILSACQADLDRLKRQAPAEIDPVAARARGGIASLEAWGR